jgi:hypothetical protein
MSVFSKIRGTFETLFQIGKNGPQIKNNAGVMQIRNSTDAAFNRLQVATPTAADDAVTKSYADGLSDESGIRVVRFTTALVDVSSVNSVPANARVVRAILEVTTPYSVGALISIGRTGSVSLFQSTGDNDPETANTYIVDQDTAFGGSALPVLATITGAPAAGAGVVSVWYVETPLV